MNQLNVTSQANVPALPDRLPNGRFPKGVAQTMRHGMAGKKIHRIWSGMRARCLTASASGYANYGGRGITVCERWSSFENFFADMGDSFRDGASIDRIDNNGNYSPENCRWSTTKEQNRNQRGLIYITLNGKTQCLSAWAEELGIKAGTIRGRINNGWDHEKALMTPVRGHKEYEYRNK